jgi:hypothetical protein
MADGGFMELSQRRASVAIAKIGQLTRAASSAIGAEDLRGVPLRPLAYRVALPSEWDMGERDTAWEAIAARPWIPVLEAMRAVLRDV